MDPHLRSSISQLSNLELLASVKHLAQREREVTASLIAHLAELDSRQLFLAEGYPSLFAYCTKALQLSEHAAYGRIQAARIVRRFPVILERLEDGSVNLTTVVLLAPHLTAENIRELLKMARHRSKREIEKLLVEISPQALVPASVRKLPIPRQTEGAPMVLEDTAAATSSPTTEARGVAVRAVPIPAASLRGCPAVVAPVAPERYRVQFTASAQMYEKFRRAQDLLRHQIPDGDPAAIFDRALTALLEKLVKQKLAATDRPHRSRGSSPRSRHIPAQVKRAVWRRDGGQCAFVGANGRRCTERGFLEFHHVDPYAAGGESTVGNIQLRCRAHNGYEAELYFGPCNPRRVSEPPASYPAASEEARPSSRSAGQLGPDRVARSDREVGKMYHAKGYPALTSLKALSSKEGGHDRTGVADPAKGRPAHRDQGRPSLGPEQTHHPFY